MLIINAPGFFSMFWGLIKKFIDPRTAQRIQVFSNEEKGLAALRKLVDEEEIPVDYGGKNKSVKQAFMDEAADPALKKQEIELLQVKRKGTASLTSSLALSAGEYMEIRVYTRSVSAAEITVEFNGDIYATVPVMCCWSTSSDPAGGTTSTPLPNSVEVVDKLLGPGTVNIVAKDLDNVDKNKSSAGASRGFFLVVCNIKTITPEEPMDTLVAQ